MAVEQRLQRQLEEQEQYAAQRIQEKDALLHTLRQSLSHCNEELAQSHQKVEQLQRQLRLAQQQDGGSNGSSGGFAPRL